MLTIVSGEPRSGTSLMMQTLTLLGVPIWAADEESRFKLPEELSEHAKKLNPKGFFETPFVSRGINLEQIEKRLQDKPEKYEEFKKLLVEHDGHVIKIITGGLLHTSPFLIGKIIFCARNPRAISFSQTELSTNVSVANNEKWEYPVLPNDCMRYIRDMTILLQKLDEYRDKICMINYEDMISKPAETIQKIISFLNISPSPSQEQRLLAIQNIDPKLNRKSDPPLLEGEQWILANRLYEKLLKMEKIEAEESLFLDIKAFFKQKSKENAMWLEESIWMNCDVSLYKELQVNEKTREALTKNAIAREQKGMICTACPHFNRDGSPYTIERMELGDLTRNKVKCAELKKEMTLEACQIHWDKKKES